jgi:hypothetical protein
MQGAKFSRNKTYLAYVAVTGKLKQRRRLDFFSGIRAGLERKDHSEVTNVVLPFQVIEQVDEPRAEEAV